MSSKASKKHLNQKSGTNITPIANTPLNNSMNKGEKLVFILLSVISASLLIYGYKGHFHNPFYLDDSHTIVNNQCIRDITNIPGFFSDATTTSSYPANQAYRPGLTTLNTIDYWIGEKFFSAREPQPVYFHVDIFITYILLGILLFFMFSKLFSISMQHRWNRIFALAATSFYMLHTANVETITYIISRSDSFSTLMIVLAMVMYLYKPAWRKFYIYAFPIMIGFFVKEPTIMFAPILFVFILLFEEKISFVSVFNGEKTKAGLHAFFKIIPLFILAILLFSWAIYKTPPTWSSGAGTSFTDRIEYLQTQTFVIVHYFNNFFVPINLSADTDWKLIKNFDYRVVFGIIFIATLITIAFITSKHEKYKPVSFGICWFLIALIPTSSIFPFAEVLNDHRTFFPYIGLTMASIWPLALLVVKFEKKIIDSNIIVLMILIGFVAILTAHTIGVRTRVKIWGNAETLWHDVTIKSPNNGRGLMLYGNALMKKNEFSGARKYFNKAVALIPKYPDIYIHLGTLEGLSGNIIAAENHYKYALQLDDKKTDSYYYYANWLYLQGRIDDAKMLAQQGLNISSNHTDLNSLWVILQQLPSGATALDAAILRAQIEPSADNYINLSVEHHKAGNYILSIQSAEEALKLKPGFDLAYNNISAIYNILKQWDMAIEAATKGLNSNPGNAQLQEKLEYALQGKQNSTALQQLPKGSTALDSAIIIAKAYPSLINYFELSVAHYKAGNYELSIKSAEAALQLKPDYDLAYNNICASYYSLKKWDKAIEAAQKGLEINPNNELLRNNLNAVLIEKEKNK